MLEIHGENFEMNFCDTGNFYKPSLSLVDEQLIHDRAHVLRSGAVDLSSGI